MSSEQQDIMGKVRSASANFITIASTAGGVINTNDCFISTERKNQNEKVKVLAKQKKEHKHNVVLSLRDKVKELIEQKRVKGIDLYVSACI